MSRILLAILLTVTTLTPLSSLAFGLPKLSDVVGSSDKANTPDLTGTQDQLVKQYVSAGKSVLDGNSKMAEAVGLAKDAAAARASSDSLSEGATKSALSDADKTSSDTSKAVAEALKNSSGLDAPAKVKFVSGIVSLAQGLSKYVGMTSLFGSFTQGLSNVSPLMLPKLQSGAYIVSTTPASIKNLSSALSNAISYAKSHDIAVPTDATDALSKL